MLRIESLTLREIAMNLKEPFQISSGTQSQRRILLVELEDSDGAVAWVQGSPGARAIIAAQLYQAPGSVSASKRLVYSRSSTAVISWAPVKEA